MVMLMTAAGYLCYGLESIANYISLPHWINAGIYLFKPEIFDYMPEKGDLEATVFPKMAEEGKLKAVLYKGYGFWRSIDTFKDVEEAERLLAEKKSDL
jgi:NDP-sugar pyrophosphorylase family protein